ncbi:hypothetical protein U2F26_13790 [Micromonospora sp. 4G57]|uniref:Uncharacterized protein n=1 Tax=Micromonospora sicca TaxID=2202420 RepID=A0ABU5JAT5_9ACTN|nr:MULTISPECIES: hypothetical protein [unclassified Micromonospora]MDZ5443796.1 hypothetical protein [Micromonospora sp. 4G57]MDZ5489686.1 hypothetical protein [Micromonospora sp. 4G53]
MDQFDAIADLGRALGMNEATARQFAIGRDGTEGTARRRWSTREAQPQPAAADPARAQAEAAQAAIDAEMAVLGRTREQASEHVRAMVRDAGARRGVAYATQLATEYARALRSPES